MAGFWQTLGEIGAALADASTEQFVCDTEGQMVRKDGYDTFELTLTQAQARELREMPHAKRKAELARIRTEQSYSSFGRRW